VAFKRITLIDPYEEIPTMTVLPSPDGYARAHVNRRKAEGRTPHGTTIYKGNVGDSYFNWVVSADAIQLQDGTIRWMEEDDALLFEALARRQNDRYAVPQSKGGHWLLVDEYRLVPPVVPDSDRFDIVSGSKTLHGLKTGFAAFKVILTLDTEYLKDVTSCKVRLNFSAEEVS
jgi:hypothetical protein